MRASSPISGRNWKSSGVRRMSPNLVRMSWMKVTARLGLSSAMKAAIASRSDSTKA